MGILMHGHRAGWLEKADGGFELKRQLVEVWWRLEGGMTGSVGVAGGVVE